MSQGSRRFTDREVALVLKRATEFDESTGGEGAEGGGGLSLEELSSIGAEVGISRTAIERAVASLDRGARVSPSLLGAPTVRKAVHAVPAELDRSGIARLVSLVDERADGAGSVTEALGSVRWTSSDRFRSTRVSITPAHGQTTIEVVEKAEPRLRRIFHFVPAAWGLMLAGPILGGLQLTGLAAAAGIALGPLAGAAVGRFVWSRVSAASEKRVRRLAGRLADEAVTGRTALEAGAPEAR